MAGSIEKAKLALDEIVERVNRIDSRRLSPEGKALRSSIADMAQVVQMLLNNTAPANDQ